MKKIRIGGVPEHFNLPWYQAIEDGDFQSVGIDVHWTDYPDGTGAMTKALEEDKIDIAIVLTEGIIKAIHAENPARIVQTYVESPLKWGIHVAASSEFHSIEDLQGKRIAISRPGSGSHLMSYLHAESMGWPVDQLRFVEIGTLPGAIKALQQREADYFMWEHYTTKPIVDSGIFRRLGDYPTPWPCFVIAVSQHYLQTSPDVIRQLLDSINQRTLIFKNIPNIEKQIAERFGQQETDVRQWLKQTNWSQHLLSNNTLDFIQQKLTSLGIIERPTAVANLLHSL